MEIEIELNGKLVKVVDLEVEGVNGNDASDFVDAFVSGGCVELENGSFRDLTIAELNQINADSELVYAAVLNYLF